MGFQARLELLCPAAGAWAIMRCLNDAAGLERSLGYLRLHAVQIFVRDQERSVRFYVDQLGFRLTYDVRLESGG
jgi:Glyoxalase/Bleomycin resistance protein/Dioxygenase superfamily